jgi:hypothetical protein
MVAMGVMIACMLAHVGRRYGEVCMYWNGLDELIVLHERVVHHAFFISGPLRQRL